MIWKHILLGAVMLFAALGVQAGVPVDDIKIDALGSRLEIVRIFDPSPPTGHAAFKVVASNAKSKPQTWDLYFLCKRGSYGSTHQWESEFKLEIDANSTKAQTLLVPVGALYTGYSPGSDSKQMEIRITGDGFDIRRSHYEGGIIGMPAIAISEALAFNRLDSFQKALQKQSGSSLPTGRSVSQYSPTELPEDWRAYSGFDVIMLSGAEWLALKPGPRMAVLQWVRLGGCLDVYLSATVDRTTLRSSLDMEGRFSLGKIEYIDGYEKEFDVTKAAERYAEGRIQLQRFRQITNDYTSSSWPLSTAIGKRSSGTWQVTAFLVIFGILVGPVNLFILAPRSRRYRLFVTTPLLSVGASTVMFCILFFQDGAGGIGRRFIAINLEASEASAYATQEQISRTGLLFGSSFETSQTAVVEPLVLPKSPWVKLQPGYGGGNIQIRQSGNSFSGNAFQSRTVQAQLLRAVVPSRARLELKASTSQSSGGVVAPEMVSALGVTVSQLYYVDDDRKVWKSTGAVSTGQPIKFTASTINELETWWSTQCVSAGTLNKKNLVALVSHEAKNVFFAKAANTPDFAVNTLNSIQWSDDQVVIFGTVK